jgi:PAP2 superfamily protein
MAATVSPPSAVTRIRVSRRARMQIGLFLLAYLLYSAARWVTVGDLGAAKAHADWIVHLERHLGVADEGSVQRALSGTFAIWVLNHLYLAAQLVVVPGALVFVYRRSRPIYERLRNTILATWLISIPVYALFPVAPPRLAGIGMVDTISTQTGFAMDSKLTTSFYNQLAAVPSLHVGFAVAVGIAIAAAVRHPLAKTVALLWGPAIALAVVATGNHFVFDIAAGLVASAAGYAVGIAIARAGSTPRPVRPSAPAPAPARRRGFGEALPEAA